MSVDQLLHFRHLRTTGSSDRAKKFRAKLINLCNEDKIVKVLHRCFKEYTRNRIDLKNHKVTVVNSLEEYSNLDLIDNIQKKKIISELFKKRLINKLAVNNNR